MCYYKICRTLILLPEVYPPFHTLSILIFIFSFAAAMLALAVPLVLSYSVGVAPSSRASSAYAHHRPPLSSLLSSLDDPEAATAAIASRWSLFRKTEGGFVLRPTEVAWEEEEIDVSIERPAGTPGIGLQLTEFGSADDSALVLVEGALDGSNAADRSSVPILPGDAIIAAGVPGGELIDVQGATYDATVEALLAADPAAGAIQLKLKRLSKRPSVALRLQFPESEERAEERLTLYGGENLRRAMFARGVKLNDPLARRFDAGVGTGDCGGEGCCCTCAIDVVSGAGVLSEQQTQERQMLVKFPR